MPSNPLMSESFATRNEILANATPWQIAELINYVAQNLKPFVNLKPSGERLSENPLFADLAQQPLTIQLYTIRALSNTLDRIPD